MDTLRSAISKARYVNLATFRRDGREVRTPVWMAEAAGRHFVFTARSLGKIKRLAAIRAYASPYAICGAPYARTGWMVMQPS